MRFAGMRMEGFMNDDRPDYGQMAINNDNRETEFVNKSNEAEAYVGATGIKTAGDVEAAGIIADAKAGVAQAQGNAAMMKGIGSIASSALGAFGSPSGGGGGGSAGMAWNPAGVDTSAYSDNLSVAGQDYSSFLSNPTFKW